MAPAYSLSRSFQLLNRVFPAADPERRARLAGVAACVPAGPHVSRIGRRSAICATAAFAAVPEMMFNISHIGPDSLVLVLTTALAAAAVRFRTRRPMVTLIIVARPLSSFRCCYCRALPRRHPDQSVSRRIFQMDWIRAADFAWHSHIWFGNASFLGLRSWVYDIILLMFLGGLFGVARSWKRNGYPVLALLVVQAMFVVALAWYGIAIFRATGNSLPPGWYLSAGCRGVCAAGVRIPRAQPRGHGHPRLPVRDSRHLWLARRAGALLHRPDLLLIHRTPRRVPARQMVVIVFDRLAFNKPEWLGSFTFSTLWAAYVIATCTLVGIAVWAAGVGRLDVWRSTE